MRLSRADGLGSQTKKARKTDRVGKLSAKQKSGA
jgi:hypothetical protein